MRIDIFLTIVLLNNFISLKCFDLVEFLFGPRLQSRIDNLHEDHLLDAVSTKLVLHTFLNNFNAL